MINLELLLVAKESICRATIEQLLKPTTLGGRTTAAVMKILEGPFALYVSLATATAIVIATTTDTSSCIVFQRPDRP